MFPTIICFGANAAMPHHMPDDTKLGANEFVLIDCGSRYRNYCSDVTRTFIYKPDRKIAKYKKMLDMYNVVAQAQRIGMSEVMAGAQGKAAHLAAQDCIDKASKGVYKGTFIHSLGHPIGVEVHDVGVGLYPSEKDKLREGMVVSVEPGIYIPGFGGVRIEDDVLVTKKGMRVL